MLRRLPETIDLAKFCETGRSLEGEIAVADLSRLAQVLANTDGNVSVDLVFGLDEQGHGRVSGTLRARLALVCQRCLEPFSLPFDVALNLGLVATESQAEYLPEGVEPLLAGAGPVRVRELVEDELLLALPIVPMHEVARCPAHIAGAGDDAGAQRQHPFAVLADLKGRLKH